MTYPRGEDTHSAKLTERDVVTIRQLYANGTKLRELARLYPQCTKPNLHHIVNQRRWKFLPAVEAFSAQTIDIPHHHPNGRA